VVAGDVVRGVSREKDALTLSLDEKVRQRFVAAARAAGFLDASRPPSDDEAIPE